MNQHDLRNILHDDGITQKVKSKFSVENGVT